MCVNQSDSSIEGLKVNQKYPENAVDCKIVCCAMPPPLLRNLKCLPTGLDSFQTSRQLRRLVGPFEHLHHLFTNIYMNIHASRAVLNHVVAWVATPALYNHHHHHHHHQCCHHHHYHGHHMIIANAPLTCFVGSGVRSWEEGLRKRFM